MNKMKYIFIISFILFISSGYALWKTYKKEQLVKEDLAYEKLNKEYREVCSDPRLKYLKMDYDFNDKWVGFRYFIDEKEGVAL